MDKKQTKVIQSAISCIAIFCLLSLSLILLLGNMSLGWFASNESVDADKMNVRIDGTEIIVAYYYKTAQMADYAEMTAPEQMIEGLMPGDTVRIRVEYTNKDDRSFSLSPYLDYEDGFEAPLVSEGRYYYLSSQLRVNDTLMLSGATDDLYFTEQQTPTDIYFDAIEGIAPEETKELEFTITFIHLDKDQNMYQNFSGRCIRAIRTDYTVNA